MIKKHIVIIIFDGVNLLDASGPAQVFTQANSVQANQSIHYEIQIASRQGGLITSNSGIRIDTIALQQIEQTSIHTLIIAGGDGVHQALKDSGLIHLINQAASHTVRTGSVCTGAFLLATTGLLDNKRAVTHWQYIDQLQHSFPRVKVLADPIYTCDQTIWTCAGITAGIDMALAMVNEDLGHKCSLQTARELVVYLKRHGGQSQFSAPLKAQAVDNSGLFNGLHNWIMDNLETRLSTHRLADQVNMSPRNFFRLYKKHTGKTPAKTVATLRLQSAKLKLEENTTGIGKISRQCGFSSEETMRRAFVRNFGISPHEYRKRFSR